MVGQGQWEQDCTLPSQQSSQSDTFVWIDLRLPCSSQGDIPSYTLLRRSWRVNVTFRWPQLEYKTWIQQSQHPFCCMSCCINLDFTSCWWLVQEGHKDFDESTAKMWANAEIFDVKTEKMFRYLQVFSACVMSLAHGSNDIGEALPRQ